MGNSGKKPEEFEIVSSYNNRHWHLSQNLTYCQLWLNTLLDLPAEVYEVPADTTPEQLNKYTFRNQNNKNIVGVYHVVYPQNEYLCSRNDKMNVLTERIPIRLDKVNNLTEDQALSVLLGAYSGYNTIGAHYGPIRPNESAIGFTQAGKTKVWVNPNFGSNEPWYQPNTVDGTQLQKMNRKYVDQIFEMVNKKTIGGLPRLKNIFQAKQPTYFEAINVIEHYADMNGKRIANCIRPRHQENLSGSVYNKASRVAQITNDRIVGVNPVPIQMNSNAIPPLNQQTFFTQQQIQNQHPFQHRQVIPNYQQRPIPRSFGREVVSMSPNANNLNNSRLNKQFSHNIPVSQQSQYPSMIKQPNNRVYQQLLVHESTKKQSNSPIQNVGPLRVEEISKINESPIIPFNSQAVPDFSKPYQAPVQNYYGSKQAISPLSYPNRGVVITNTLKQQEAKFKQTNITFMGNAYPNNSHYQANRQPIPQVKIEHAVNNQIYQEKRKSNQLQRKDHEQAFQNQQVNITQEKQELPIKLQQKSQLLRSKPQNVVHKQVQIVSNEHKQTQMLKIAEKVESQPKPRQTSQCIQTNQVQNYTQNNRDVHEQQKYQKDMSSNRASSSNRKSRLAEQVNIDLENQGYKRKIQVQMKSDTNEHPEPLEQKQPAQISNIEKAHSIGNYNYTKFKNYATKQQDLQVNAGSQQAQGQIEKSAREDIQNEQIKPMSINDNYHNDDEERKTNSSRPYRSRYRNRQQEADLQEQQKQQKVELTSSQKLERSGIKKKQSLGGSNVSGKAPRKQQDLKGSRLSGRSVNKLSQLDKQRQQLERQRAALEEIRQKKKEFWDKKENQLLEQRQQRIRKQNQRQEERKKQEQQIRKKQQQYERQLQLERQEKKRQRKKQREQRQRRIKQQDQQKRHQIQQEDSQPQQSANEINENLRQLSNLTQNANPSAIEQNLSSQHPSHAQEARLAVSKESNFMENNEQKRIDIQKVQQHNYQQGNKQHEQIYQNIQSVNKTAQIGSQQAQASKLSEPISGISKKQVEQLQNQIRQKYKIRKGSGILSHASSKRHYRDIYQKQPQSYISRPSAQQYQYGRGDPITFMPNDRNRNNFVIQNNKEGLEISEMEKNLIKFQESRVKKLESKDQGFPRQDNYQYQYERKYPTQSAGIKFKKSYQSFNPIESGNLYKSGQHQYRGNDYGQQTIEDKYSKYVRNRKGSFQSHGDGRNQYQRNQDRNEYRRVFDRYSRNDEIQNQAQPIQIKRKKAPKYGQLLAMLRQ